METNISFKNGTRIPVLLSFLTALVISTSGIVNASSRSDYAAYASVNIYPIAKNNSASQRALPQQDDLPSFQIYLPVVMNYWPPIPDNPVLNQIDNTDQDNLYTITWLGEALADTYILEEATNSSFSNVTVVYQGSALSWTTPAQGKTPASYFYRLKARNSWGDSSWSNIQSVTIYPLFVGLQLRWDSMGYIRGSQYYDVGYHWTNNLDLLTEPDTIRTNNYVWYDPNPQGWASDAWFSYYSVLTGEWKSSSVPDDPSWKWGFPWKLGYTSQFSNGQIVNIDGQNFTASGPNSGYTAFGKAVQYWQFVNKNKFLFWDGGGDWKQYCNPGDVTLRYDLGSSRLLLYDNVMRRYYYKGNLTTDTVQYIENLTYVNFFQGVTTSAVEELSPFPGKAQIDDNGIMNFRGPQPRIC